MPISEKQCLALTSQGAVVCLVGLAFSWSPACMLIDGFRLDIGNKFFPVREVVQRSCGCPIPGSILGQAG